LSLSENIRLFLKECRALSTTHPKHSPWYPDFVGMRRRRIQMSRNDACHFRRIQGSLKEYRALLEEYRALLTTHLKHSPWYFGFVGMRERGGNSGGVRGRGSVSVG